MLLYFRLLWGDLFGVHVCTEFTRWETVCVTYSRPVTVDDWLVGGDLTEIKYIRRHQERVCTVCGKMQQRDLLR